MKFSGSSGGKIIGHCEREKNKDGEYLKYHSKSNIDLEKTHLNVYIVPNDEDAHKRYESRKEQVGVKRKDQVTMVDWVITLPKELNYLEYEQKVAFFKSCNDFVAQRYGENNLIGCFMHFDESQPHAHIPFLPVKEEKFNCKNVLNRRDLSSFHEDLTRHLQNDKTLDFRIEKEFILNGKTKTNKETEELKAEQEQEITALKEEKAELQSEVAQLKNEVSSFADFRFFNTEVEEVQEIEIPTPKTSILGGKISYTPEEHSILEKAFSSLKSAIKSLKDKVTEQKQEIMELKSNNLDKYKENQQLQAQIGVLKGDKERLQLRYEKLKGTAWVKEKDDLLEENKSLKAENEALKEKASKEYDRGYFNGRKSRADEVKELKEDNEWLKKVKEKITYTLGVALGTQDKTELKDYHDRVHKQGKYEIKQRDRGWDMER